MVRVIPINQRLEKKCRRTVEEAYWARDRYGICYRDRILGLRTNSLNSHENQVLIVKIFRGFQWKCRNSYSTRNILNKIIRRIDGWNFNNMFFIGEKVISVAHLICFYYTWS